MHVQFSCPLFVHAVIACIVVRCSRAGSLDDRIALMLLFMRSFSVVAFEFDAASPCFDYCMMSLFAVSRFNAFDLDFMITF